MRIVEGRRRGRLLAAQTGWSTTEMVVTVAVLLVFAGLVLPRFVSLKQGAYNAMAMSALEDLARAQGSRQVVEGGYASCNSVADCCKQFPELRLNSDLVVYATADDEGFTAVAMHPQGDQKYVWDSRAGGLQLASAGAGGGGSGAGGDGGGSPPPGDPPPADPPPPPDPPQPDPPQPPDPPAPDPPAPDPPAPDPPAPDPPGNGNGNAGGGNVGRGGNGNGGNGNGGVGNGRGNGNGGRGNGNGGRGNGGRGNGGRGNGGRGRD